MNERIKELAEQAQVGSAEFDNGINYFVSTEKTFNKFAELIVAECVKIADHSNVTGKSIIGERIKQHFGVVE